MSDLFRENKLTHSRARLVGARRIKFEDCSENIVGMASRKHWNRAKNILIDVKIA